MNDSTTLFFIPPENRFICSKPQLYVLRGRWGKKDQAPVYSDVADRDYRDMILRVSHETSPPPVIPAKAVVLRFDEDQDERHQQLEAQAHIVQSVPRQGEVVNIEHQFHAVTQVIHNYDADGIEVHLGPSSETPAEAVEKTESKAENP